MKNERKAAVPGMVEAIVGGLAPATRAMIIETLRWINFAAAYGHDPDVCGASNLLLKVFAANSDVTGDSHVTDEGDIYEHAPNMEASR